MTMFSANFSDVILWQYDKSTNLKNLIYKKQSFYNDNVDNFFTNWYRDVFNIDTANHFGLLIWALILGCTEYIEITSNIDHKSFGFGPYHKNFNESNFYLSNYIYTLPVELLRKVLKAQMYNFNSNGSLYDINKVLNIIYPEHNPYATYDKDTNVLTYHFPIPLNRENTNIVMFSNMFPAPVGVRRSIQNGTIEEE